MDSSSDVFTYEVTHIAAVTWQVNRAGDLALSHSSVLVVS